MSKIPEDADTILASLESQMAIAELVKRGEYATGIATIAGHIRKAAIAAGIPRSMAREMASDFWKAEMLADTIVALINGSGAGSEE